MAMGDVADYLATVEEPHRAELARVYAIAAAVVPGAVEGTSYAMAALLYRGKGLIATVRAKKFLSLYPYSGTVLSDLAGDLTDFETTSGSLHYSIEHPVPDDLLRRIVALRRDEIDAKAR
jgi:uncharacterized protein YdhG (YjbR/CyaY superfamily)